MTTRPTASCPPGPNKPTFRRSINLAPQGRSNARMTVADTLVLLDQLRPLGSRLPVGADRNGFLLEFTTDPPMFESLSASMACWQLVSNRDDNLSVQVCVRSRSHPRRKRNDTG